MAKTKNENEPITVEKSITWQEQTQEKLDKARTEKNAEAIVYYLERLQDELPGAVFDMFKDSFAYPYWLEENQTLVDATQKTLEYNNNTHYVRTKLTNFPQNAISIEN